MNAGITERMKEVEKVVLELDESVRGAAFSMMSSYILGGAIQGMPSTPPPKGPSEDGGASAGEGLEGFFADRDINKAAEAVQAIAAYLFQQFGSEPFTVNEIKQIADEVGLTVPERIDMTLKAAKKNGKPMFRSVGKGKFGPTVLGEATLKQDHGVTKGRKKRAVDDAGES